MTDTDNARILDIILRTFEPIVHKVQDTYKEEPYEALTSLCEALLMVVATVPIRQAPVGVLTFRGGLLATFASLLLVPCLGANPPLRVVSATLIAAAIEALLRDGTSHANALVMCREVLDTIKIGLHDKMTQKVTN